MSSTKNTKIQIVTAGTKQTIPDNISAMVATMSTTGKWVNGVGTFFTLELAPGAWIFDYANDEVRKVIEVVDDTTALLESPFTTDIVPMTAYNYIPLYFVKEIGCSATGGTYTVDTVTVPAGTSLSWGKTSGMKDTSTNNWVDPIIVNADGGVDVFVQTLLYY